MKFFQANKDDDKNLVMLGILSSLVATIYIVAVVIFINNAQRIFGKEDNSFFIPVIMLMLFVLSALITGLIILGKPVMLYFDGRKKEAVKLVICTVTSLAVLLVLVVLAYLGLR